MRSGPSLDGYIEDDGSLHPAEKCDECNRAAENVVQFYYCPRCEQVICQNCHGHHDCPITDRDAEWLYGCSDYDPETRACVRGDDCEPCFDKEKCERIRAGRKA